MSRAAFILRKKEDRDSAARLCRAAPDGTRVEFKAPRRSLPQNDLMWARCTDLSRQLVWHGTKLSPQDWKTVLMASFKRQRVVPTPDGGFVQLDLSTSDLTKQEMTDFLELISHFANHHEVTLSDEDENA